MEAGAHGALIGTPRSCRCPSKIKGIGALQTCQHGLGCALARQESDINAYLWCAIGAALGWGAGGLATMQLTTQRIESMLVGVFGAFIGGEFVVAMIRGGPPVPGFDVLGVALAVLGAVIMLLLLAAMRRSVGPMRASKSRKADH